jgi:type IV secretion system protein TrbB
VLTDSQRSGLLHAIIARRNILVGGGTNSGKTTFANALLHEIERNTTDRLYIAEDIAELQCAAPNLLRVRTRRGAYELRDAIFDALRARPERIIVGELRDGSALGNPFTNGVWK